jgi:hypothetical protein
MTNRESFLGLDSILAAWLTWPNVSCRERGLARRREAVSCCLVRRGTQSTIHLTHVRKLAWENSPGRVNKAAEVGVTSHQTGLEKFSRAKVWKRNRVILSKAISICSSLSPTPQAVAIVTSRSHTRGFLTTRTQRPTQLAQQIPFRRSWQLHHQSVSASPEPRMA